MNRLIMQIDFCQIIHPVAKFRLKNIVSNHCVEERAFYFHSIILENNHIVLDILPHFQGTFVFEYRSKLIDDF